MKNSNFAIGQKAIFNYDRSYMTTQEKRNHDGETVTVLRDAWNAQGHTYMVVENARNCIYPVLIHELTHTN